MRPPDLHPELVQKLRGHHGHPGRPGFRGGSARHHAASLFRRAFSLLSHAARLRGGRVIENPSPWEPEPPPEAVQKREADKLVVDLTTLLDDAWQAEASGLVSAGSPTAIDSQARAAWERAYEKALPAIDDRLDRALRTAPESVRSLTGDLVEAFVSTLGERRIGQRLRQVAEVEPDMVPTAVAAGVPHMIQVAVQPLVQRIRSFLSVSDIDMKGGPGSGNFGHAGRPGQVGGSAPGDGGDFDPSKPSPATDRIPPADSDPAPGGRYEYHSTDAGNLATIASEGLKPGGRGYDNAPISVTPHTTGVHFYSSNVRGENIYVLRMARKDLRARGARLEIPGGDDEEDENWAPDEEESREHWVWKTVPADIIEVYWKGSWRPLTTLVKKGGPGSGNFGHAGRPGQVGGSAPGNGPAAAGGAEPAREAPGGYKTWGPNYTQKQLDSMHAVFSAFMEGDEGDDYDDPDAEDDRDRDEEEDDDDTDYYDEDEIEEKEYAPHVYLDRQMRGGVLNRNTGKFTPFTPETKRKNLTELKYALGDIRSKNPEAFEQARRLVLADVFKAKSYEHLPDRITVYRGETDEDASRTSGPTNVTWERAVAEKWGSHGVTTYTISKHDIDLVFDSASAFDEGEMIVFDKGRLTTVKRDRNASRT